MQKNRATVAEYFGAVESQLQSVHQIHSADVVTLSAISPDSSKADAMVTATPSVILGILTADCPPVLFYDPEAQVIGAVHAGSKGAKAGELQKTVAAMALTLIHIPEPTRLGMTPYAVFCLKKKKKKKNKYATVIVLQIHTVCRIRVDNGHMRSLM